MRERYCICISFWRMTPPTTTLMDVVTCRMNPSVAVALVVLLHNLPDPTVDVGDGVSSTYEDNSR